MHRAPGGAASPLVMVGTVAVRPDDQNDGHGRALMAQMLTAAETGADGALKIGRAHVCTPVTNEHLVCRLLLEKITNLSQIIEIIMFNNYSSIISRVLNNKD